MICQYKTILIEADTINEDFVAVAERIKDKYELVLISDGLAQNKGVDKYIQTKIFGAEAGCKKPSIEFFDFVLEKIGKKPSECILVDCQVKSLLFAEEVGISTLFFNVKNENFDGMSVCSFKELIDVIG